MRGHWLEKSVNVFFELVGIELFVIQIVIAAKYATGLSEWFLDTFCES